MIVYSSTKQPLKIDDSPFSRGGEGAVYGIPSLPKYCAKIYHQEKRTRERQLKLEFMVSHAPKSLITPSYIICWPTKLIFDAKGSFLGFVMPRGFENSVLCYQICRMGISKDLDPVWETCYSRKTKQGIVNRLKLLVNIAIPINAIHSMGAYVLVDCKPQNILITPDGKISIIDLDSVQINTGNNNYLCNVYTPDYLPPELQHDTTLGTTLQPLSCDLFALSVIYYQILYGLHPFTVTPKNPKYTQLCECIFEDLFPYGQYAHKIEVIPGPHRKFLLLPASIQQLFRLGLSNVPSARPSAEQWGKTIYDFIIAMS